MKEEREEERRCEEMRNDHEGVGGADLERLVRHRGFQLHLKLPK